MPRAEEQHASSLYESVPALVLTHSSHIERYLISHRAEGVLVEHGLDQVLSMLQARSIFSDHLQPDWNPYALFASFEEWSTIETAIKQRIGKGQTDE